MRAWVAGAHACDVTNAGQLATTLASVRPDRIFYLAGQSSVSASFLRPVQTWQSCTMGLVMLLPWLSEHPTVRTVVAGSGECFGPASREAPATEGSPLRPQSPYAAAKCGAHAAVMAAREGGAHIATAFLFSHESTLRPETFVVGKIRAAAQRIAAGSRERLQLGDLSVVRDWGWAPEYVDALARMSELAEPEDFIIATGHSYTLENMVQLIFAAFGLDWRAHVDADAPPDRPVATAEQHADPGKAARLLGWRGSTHGEALAKCLASVPC